MSLFGGCPAVCSSLYILDSNLKTLLMKDWRGDTDPSMVERFVSIVNNAESESELKPIIYDEEIQTSFTYIRHHDLYFLALTRGNANAVALLTFLHRLVDIFIHYFKELKEESIRDNFVIIYELLDEVMDNGYPQFTEAKILSEFITVGAHELQAPKAPMAVTNAVSWRSEGLRYQKNEVFLDVVELSVQLRGQRERADCQLRGERRASRMRTQLSGMPECKLGLNDKVMLQAQNKSTRGKSVELEDIKFHQCVRLRALRERQDHLVHTPGRPVRSDELQDHHPGQAPDLGRGESHETLLEVQGRLQRQAPNAVQVEAERDGHRGETPGAGGRDHAGGQSRPGERHVRPGAGGDAVEDQDGSRGRRLSR